MSQQNEIVFKIKEREDISINSDNPDLSKIIDNVIVVEDIDIEDLEIKTEIENFDIEGFKEIITTTIKEIREMIEVNNENLKKYTESLKFDESVSDYYRKIKETKED